MANGLGCDLAWGAECHHREFFSIVSKSFFVATDNLQLTNFLSSDWHAIGGRCKSMLGKISDADWSAFMGEEDESKFKAGFHAWEELCAKVEGGF